MREQELYRDHYEVIVKKFPKELIPISKAAEWLGTTKDSLLKDKDFKKKQVGNRWYITRVALAKGLS